MTGAQIEQIAIVCHEANRAYCVTLGDGSQPAWSDAPEWQRESAMEGVRFHLAHPGAHPAESHEQWRLHKIGQGWSYGPTKDCVARTDPCLVPFHQLPPSQQRKAILSQAIVRVLGR